MGWFGSISSIFDSVSSSTLHAQTPDKPKEPVADQDLDQFTDFMKQLRDTDMDEKLAQMQKKSRDQAAKKKQP